jgi:hypothetical protein
LLNLKNTSLLLSTQVLVDSGNFFTPPLPFSMFHVNNLFKRPMEVVRDESYLLIYSIEGVAYYSP